MVSQVVNEPSPRRRRPRLGRPGPRRPRPFPSGRAQALRARVRSRRLLLLERLSALLARAARQPVLAALLGALGRVLDVVTPLGRWSLLAVLLAWPVALLTHWQEVWGVAVVLTVLLVLALPTVIGRRTYQVQVSLASGRVTVGEPAIGTVRLSNPAPRRVGGSAVELPVGAGTAVFQVPRLAGKASHEEVFTIPTRRRGVIVVGPVTSVRGDPVGLLRRRQRWNEPVELFVHPRTTAIDAESIGFIRDIEGAVTQELSSSDVSFHALRDYVPGDDRRNVHWRSTARTGRLMVRQFEETRRAHLLVVLDLDEVAWADPEEFETGVSCAASLVLAAYRADREVTLLSQAGIPVAPTAVRALDAITRLERLRTRTDLGTLARQAAQDVPHASVVALVTGSQQPATQLHRAYCQLPLAAYTLGLRVDRGSTLVSSQVGGLRLFTLGALESLPLAMRRAAQ
ncbi:DUF58 domain-containing protein [Actinomyces weissii]|uniref:DUF58 domain-containing protein n=1 Tax=Actinomyces weissii TaxID=675090 RepID=A0A7T7S269_9ACTO|nr:DUF58 domain-containing protein [Actinomyces weissii]QQM67711.1 DUF58 domain-containing protein [Actinomyces weissii]